VAQARRGAWIAVAVVVLAAVGVGTWFLVRDATESDDVPATTSTTATTEPLLAPLTGEPTDAEPQRAVAVKVDAAPNVTRFSGLERADLVYEVLVEGGITRQMALFESEDADRVGPVRSLRTSDFDLVENLGDPIVVFSGADDLTLGAALAALDTPFTEGSPGSADAFRRDTSLRAPHNLFVSTTAVREAIGEPGTIRRPFNHGPGPAGAPVGAVRIAFSTSTVVEFRWDEGRGEWLRTKDGRAQTDDADVQLGVDTVLVLDSEYTSPPWDPTSPQLESVGEGGGLLLGDGVLSPVRWARANPLLPFTLTDAVGAEVALPPGRTWVAFAPPGSSEALGD
jgi:hypothetical protein